MPNQIPLLCVENIRIAEPAPPFEEMFLVAAFARDGRYWKIHRDTHRDQYATLAAAEQRARELMASGRWSGAVVLRVGLGGGA